MLMVVAAGAQAGEKFPRCFEDPFDGHCLAVQVNGQRTVKISGRTKKMLKKMGALVVMSDETLYEVPGPVRGALEVSAKWLPEAAGFFGSPPDVSVMVIPLEGQELDTRPELSAESDVRVGGSAVVTRSDVIQDDRLPPGKYVLSVRAAGARQNWDRQTLFVQVD
jgi:hypothetical protein